MSSFLTSFSISYYVFICLHIKEDIVIIIMSELFHCYKLLASFLYPSLCLIIVDVMDTKFNWLLAKT